MNDLGMMFLSSQASVQPVRRKGNGALGAKCGDFIGSSTNLVIKEIKQN